MYVNTQDMFSYTDKIDNLLKNFNFNVISKLIEEKTYLKNFK